MVRLIVFISEGNGSKLIKVLVVFKDTYMVIH